jgi:multimeric flavodoxin WrbA
MKTLIINGSPNGRKGNTEIMCRRFMMGMQTKPEIRYVAEEDAAALAAYMNDFDNWLFFFPLYVNAMPGIVKRLFEHMQPRQSISTGYFVQSGFEETAQSDYLCALLKNFNKRMGYQDLGIVIAGGMAGVRYMPERMNKKTFAFLEQAGTLYEKNGRFDEESKRQFGKLYKYTKAQAGRNQFMRKLGLTNLFWNSMLKKNNVYNKRLDKPFGQ